MTRASSFQFRTTLAKCALVGLLFAGRVAAESITSCSITGINPNPGEAGAFTASTTSGPAGSITGAISQKYSGSVVLKRELAQSATGRFSTVGAIERLGVNFDSFLIFQSFLTPNLLTVVNANTSCPSAGPYNWLVGRFRPIDSARGAMNPSAVGLQVGGTLNYDPAASPQFTGSQFFDLAGLTTHNRAYSMTKFSENCTNAKMRLTTAGSVFDPLGTMLFGGEGFAFISNSGNPLYIVAVPQQTLTLGMFEELRSYAFNGLQSIVTSSASQTNKPIRLMVRDNSDGTTLDIFELLDINDPFSIAHYGALTCNSLNSPMTGFCSGTISYDSGGGSTNVACSVYTSEEENILNCAGIKPGSPSVGVSILARTSKKSALSVSVARANRTNDDPSSDLEVTLMNMTSRKITGLGPDYSMSGNFVEPTFVGGGTYCGDTLWAYRSCILTLQHTRTSEGTDAEVYRVSYHNGVEQVSATALAVASVKLNSISLSPPVGDLPFQAPPGEGVYYYGNDFTVIGHYASGGTQDLTGLANWSVSDPLVVVRSGNSFQWINDASTPNITATVDTGIGTLTSIYTGCTVGGVVDGSCVLCADSSSSDPDQTTCNYYCGGGSTAYPYCCTDGPSRTACTTCDNGTTKAASCTTCSDGRTIAGSCNTCKGSTTASAICCDDGPATYSGGWSRSSCDTCGDGSTTAHTCQSCSSGVNSAVCLSCGIGTAGYVAGCASCTDQTGTTCCGDGSAIDSASNCVNCGNGANSRSCNSCTVGTVGVLQSCTTCGDSNSTSSTCNVCDYGPTSVYSCNTCNGDNLYSSLSCNTCDYGQYQGYSNGASAFPCYSCVGGGGTAITGKGCPNGEELGAGLQVTNVVITPGTPAPPYNTLDATITVTNNGTYGMSYIHVNHVSGFGINAQYDDNIGEGCRKALAPGESCTTSIYDVNIPPGTPPGTYYITFEAYANRSQIEFPPMPESAPFPAVVLP